MAILYSQRCHRVEEHIYMSTASTAIPGFYHSIYMGTYVDLQSQQPDHAGIQIGNNVIWPERLLVAVWAARGLLRACA